MKCGLTSSMRAASSWETEVAAWLMTRRSFALAISRSLWKRDTHSMIILDTQEALYHGNGGESECEATEIARVISLILTVENLEKSSCDKKRRSASRKMAGGWLHSWVWRSSRVAPSSTVRNCLSMLALHTKSLSCSWALARATWKDRIPKVPLVILKLKFFSNVWYNVIHTF